MLRGSAVYFSARQEAENKRATLENRWGLNRIFVIFLNLSIHLNKVITLHSNLPQLNSFRCSYKMNEIKLRCHSESMIQDYQCLRSIC